MIPLKEQQLEKLRRLTFQEIKLVFNFKDKENLQEPEYIKVYVGNILIAVADGDGLKKSEKALSLVPLETKSKVEIDLKKLEIIYSDAVSFATYYPEDDHAH